MFASPTEVLEPGRRPIRTSSRRLQILGVSWGHDYGRLVILKDEDRFPWEDRLAERDERHSNLEHFLSAKEDPYDVPAIQQLLMETAQNLSSEKEMNSLKTVLLGRIPLLGFQWRSVILLPLTCQQRIS